MRQLVPEFSIDPGTGDRTEKGNDHYKGARSDLGKQRPGAGARNGPAQSEGKSAIDLSLIEFLGFQFDRLPINGFELEFFDQEHTDHSHHYRGTDHAVHMKALETEHFLDPVPGDDLGFYEDDTKKDTGDPVLDQGGEWFVQFGMVHAHGVFGAHFVVGIHLLCHKGFFTGGDLRADIICRHADEL